jgi:uncharacterized membrane protein YsdA (DUF1294 family)
VNSETCKDNNAKGGVVAVVASLLLMAALLVLPITALHRRGVDFRRVATYGLVINALTYWTYARDKRRAVQGEWRISEFHLHVLELLGGWPGAWLAQRRLRHKCSKGSYQFVFWLIVLGYQFAAYDSFQNRQISRAGLKWIGRTSERRRNSHSQGPFRTPVDALKRLQAESGRCPRPTSDALLPAILNRAFKGDS